MTPQQELILEKLRTLDGSALWGDLIELVPYPDRQKALSDVRVLEAQSKLTRTVAPNPDTGAMQLTIALVG